MAHEVAAASWDDVAASIASTFLEDLLKSRPGLEGVLSPLRDAAAGLGPAGPRCAVLCFNDATLSEPALMPRRFEVVDGGAAVPFASSCAEGRAHVAGPLVAGQRPEVVGGGSVTSVPPWRSSPTACTSSAWGITLPEGCVLLHSLTLAFEVIGPARRLVAPSALALDLLLEVGGAGGGPAGSVLPGTEWKEVHCAVRAAGPSSLSLTPIGGPHTVRGYRIRLEGKLEVRGGEVPPATPAAPATTGVQVASSPHALLAVTAYTPSPSTTALAARVRPLPSLPLAAQLQVVAAAPSTLALLRTVLPLVRDSDGEGVDVSAALAVGRALTAAIDAATAPSAPLPAGDPWAPANGAGTLTAGWSKGQVTQNMTISKGGMRAMSTDSASGGAYGAWGFSAGRVSWTLKLVRDTRGDEHACFGVGTGTLRNPSYSSSPHLWLLRAYTGDTHGTGSPLKAASRPAGSTATTQMHPGDVVRFDVVWPGAIGTGLDPGPTGSVFVTVNRGVEGPLVLPSLLFTGIGTSCLFPAVTAYSSDVVVDFLTLTADVAARESAVRTEAGEGEMAAVVDAAAGRAHPRAIVTPTPPPSGIGAAFAPPPLPAYAVPCPRLPGATSRGIAVPLHLLERLSRVDEGGELAPVPEGEEAEACTLPWAGGEEWGRAALAVHSGGAGAREAARAAHVSDEGAQGRVQIIVDGVEEADAIGMVRAGGVRGLPNASHGSVYVPLTLRTGPSPHARSRPAYGFLTGAVGVDDSSPRGAVAAAFEVWGIWSGGLERRLWRSAFLAEPGPPVPLRVCIAGCVSLRLRMKAMEEEEWSPPRSWPPTDSGSTLPAVRGAWLRMAVHVQEEGGGGGAAWLHDPSVSGAEADGAGPMRPGPPMLPRYGLLPCFSEADTSRRAVAPLTLAAFLLSRAVWAGQLGAAHGESESGEEGRWWEGALVAALRPVVRGQTEADAGAVLQVLAAVSARTPPPVPATDALAALLLESAGAASPRWPWEEGEGARELAAACAAAGPRCAWPLGPDASPEALLAAVAIVDACVPHVAHEEAAAAEEAEKAVVAVRAMETQRFIGETLPKGQVPMDFLPLAAPVQGDLPWSYQVAQVTSEEGATRGDKAPPLRRFERSEASVDIPLPAPPATPTVPPVPAPFVFGAAGGMGAPRAPFTFGQHAAPPEGPVLAAPFTFGVSTPPRIPSPQPSGMSGPGMGAPVLPPLLPPQPQYQQEQQELMAQYQQRYSGGGTGAGVRTTGWVVGATGPAAADGIRTSPGLDGRAALTAPPPWHPSSTPPPHAAEVVEEPAEEESCLPIADCDGTLAYGRTSGLTYAPAVALPPRSRGMLDPAASTVERRPWTACALSALTLVDQSLAWAKRAQLEPSVWGAAEEGDLPPPLTALHALLERLCGREAPSLPPALVTAASRTYERILPLLFPSPTALLGLLRTWLGSGATLELAIPAPGTAACRPRLARLLLLLQAQVTREGWELAVVQPSPSRVSLLVHLPGDQADRAAAFLERDLATTCKRAQAGSWTLPGGCGPELPLTVERAPAHARLRGKGGAAEMRLLLRSAGAFDALVEAARQAGAQ
jgi:hypothetical protein